MNAPRDHHFMPVFLLKQWTGPEGKLIEFTIKSGKLIAKPVGPRSTGFEVDLYAFDELPPDVRQFVEEEFFNYADNIAAIAHERLLAHDLDDWSAELKSGWSRFVIGVHLRHPDAMPELRAGALSVWKASGKDAQLAYEAVRKPEHPATFDEYCEKNDPLVGVKVRANMVIKSFDNETLGKRINGMRWAVIDVSASPIRLLLSDRPVQISNLKEPSGIVSMPISPIKLFVAANNPAAFDNLGHVKPRELVQNINLFVAGRARRFVWAQDEAQSRFIRRNMSKSLEPTPFFPGIGRYPPASLLP